MNISRLRSIVKSTIIRELKAGYGMEDIYVRHKIPYEVVRAYVEFLRQRKALMPVLGVNRLLNTQALRKMGIK